ncbi:MAG: hypothetical protein K0Q51_402 [Rickettsiaceae bacterium]|jgi:hypothetical protein|nr:hypothetical protein [Rickettsiaceae bacterium]
MQGNDNSSYSTGSSAEGKFENILKQYDFRKPNVLSSKQGRIKPEFREGSKVSLTPSNPVLNIIHKELDEALGLNGKKITFQAKNDNSFNLGENIIPRFKQNGIVDHIIGKPENNIGPKLKNGKASPFNVGETVVAEFVQDGIIHIAVENPEKYKNLNNSVMKFNGLCEIISNFVMANDVLDKPCSKDELYKLIRGSIDILEKEVSKTHILKIANVIELFMAFAFKKYPENIFSRNEQKKIFKDGKLERDLIGRKLDELPEGKYLKVFCLGREGLSLQGHSLLVKKCPGGRYAYFEPNSGAYYNLTKESLFNKIEQSVKAFGGQFKEVCFLDAEKLAVKKSLLKQLVEKYSPKLAKQQGRGIH